MDKTASIIIPTYNNSELLRKTLDSILNQSIKQEEIETIIVDDGSSDGTKNLCEEYSKKMNLKYFFQEDKGFRAAAARNIGIRNSDSPLCIFIDTGILLASGAIKEHINYHQRSNFETAVIGYVYGFDDFNNNGDEIKQAIDLMSVDEAIQSLKRKKIYDEREKLYQELGDVLDTWPAPWVVFWSCNVSVSKKTLFKVNLFDEIYQSWGGEDTDIGIALDKAQVRFALDRKIQSIHYPHEKKNPWALQDEKGIQEFHDKIRYMNKKYQTEATKLYIDFGWDELNQEMMRRMKQKL